MEEFEKMRQLYAHTQVLSSELVRDIGDEALWIGLLHFVHAPEKFNAQVCSSTVKAGAGDRSKIVFERTLDFGTHRVQDTAYLNPQALTVEFYVQETEHYPSSLLRVEIVRTPEHLPAVAFTYFAEREPEVPAALRPLLEQAWEQKDKDVLEHIVREALEASER